MREVLSGGSILNDTNIQMATNDTNKKLISPELSYLVVGICFDAHNTLGRYCREKQYCNYLEEQFKARGIPFEREIADDQGNRFDFLIDNEIVLEAKAKPMVLKTDYYQVQRYLQLSKKKLALLVNFQNKYLRPIRIVRIDTTASERFR